MARNLAAVVGALVVLGVVPDAHALPDLQWSTYYGGTSADQAMDIHFDAVGDLIVVGNTESTGGIADSGEDNSHNGNTDGFVTKFDPSGARLWGTYLGGSDIDAFEAVVTDSSSNIIVVGHTRSSGLATLPTSHDALQDVIVAKYDPSGALLWSTYIGGDGNDSASGVCLASNGTIYIVGGTSSTTGFATGVVHDTSLNGGLDGFVAKLTSAGAITWVTYYGGNTGTTVAHDCVVASSGDVFVTGHTTASNGIAVNAIHDGSHNGNYDAFLAKFTFLGALDWGNYYGGAGEDTARAIATDSSGDIYIAGSTESANGGGSQFIATTQDTALSGTSDAFVAKFASDGSRAWGRYFGDTGIEAFQDLEQFGGILHLAGITDSSSGIATTDAFDATHGGSTDAMYVSINATDASQVHGSYRGGVNADSAFGVAVKLGDAAFCGITNSTSGIATTVAHDTSHNGSQDAWFGFIHLFDV